ncbi:helix-turn-helix transcriptional regulator [Bacteroides muris (ex Fokt et al. 2023)]|uniref:Helix-turn-helix domain-containing protein n=1 Tax=Bacteroides muris (ex Fokt et al. 2023) TaxID=2937417 RepID=A0A9X2NSL4_9BACE|nr:helix-turn-helix domain-containing protein [Bacteroides muris (ex Fokt et al. 2023)]MCR6504627.1 helix-turn-helix domain-containing protein [Bacteroides muris (ex Fokt et al. 2023)]
MTNLLELINSGVTGVTPNVKLEDLVELVKQTIEAAKAELLPAMVSAAQEVLLTKKEVMEKFGVCHTTLWNWNKNKILIPVKVGKKVCYRQSDVERLILEKAKQ